MSPLKKISPANSMAWSHTFLRRLLPGSVWRGSLGPIHYLFAFVFLFRVISLARLTSSPFLFPSGGDMRFYDDWAQRIVRGELTDHLAFFGLPLYPYLLGLFYKVLGYTPFIPGLLQTIADTITATLIYQISVTAFGQRPEAASFLTRHRGQIIGVTAALAWAWFVPAQAFSLVIMPTALVVTGFWLMIAWIIRNPEMPTAAQSLALGSFIGLAATAVATILFALPLVLAAIFIKPAVAWERSSPWLSRISAAALLFCGAGIGTAPCWIHNYFVARDPVVLSAHSGINFWIGNNPASKGYPNFPAGMRAEQASMLEDSTTLAEAEMGRALRRSEVSAFWSAKAKAYIVANPGAWLRLLWQKTLNFWNAFEYDDLGVITKLRHAGVIWSGLHFGVVAALALPGVILALRAFPASGWVLAGILTQMVSVLPVFVTERYRLAAMPGLLIFACFGLWRLAESCSVRRLSTIALYFVVLAAGTAFVSIPRTDRALWALTAFTSGCQALDSGDFARAEQELQRARAYVPDNPETNFALGNLRLAQGRGADAKSFYDIALRLNPTHKGVLNNLALIALEENQPGHALEYLQRALKQPPQEAKTFYLLAKAQLALGDSQNARLAIGRAIERDRDRVEYRQLLEEIVRRAHE